MAVTDSFDVNTNLYPRAAVGPQGEIGFWAFQTTLAGDATGGGVVIDGTWRNIVNKLGFSVDYILFSTSTPITRTAVVTLAYRTPRNHSMSYGIQTEPITIGGSETRGRDIFRLSPMYPVSLAAPPLIADPGITLQSNNVDATSYTFRGGGKLWPHMLIQTEPERVRSVRIARQ